MLAFEAGERIEIVVQVSDRDGYYSGMIYPPAFGTPGAVQRVLNGRILTHGVAWTTALRLGLFALLPWQGWEEGGRRQVLLALFCLCFIVYTGYPLLHGWGLAGHLWKGCAGSADAALVSVVGQTITAGNEAGDSNAPKTASIDLDSTWDSISDSDLEAVNRGKVELYNDTYTAPQNTVTLQHGANELYIKVTSQNELAVAGRDVLPCYRHTEKRSCSHPDHDTGEDHSESGRGSG